MQSVSGLSGMRWSALLLALALAPGAWLAWRYADMPQIGTLHDDGLYLATAQALAERGDYRLASFPEQPWQTKYPPLYPAVLALAWKAGGLSQGLARGAWVLQLLSWLSLAALGWLAWRWFLGQPGFRPLTAGLSAALLVSSPLVLYSAQHTLADLTFCAFVVASVWLAERGRPGWAGLLGGLAFLTRTAALPLLVTSPLVYLLSGRKSSAARFGAVMLPMVAGWIAWSGAHREPSLDLVHLYYFDYAGFYRANVSLPELPWMVWQNLWFWLVGVGNLFFFDLDAAGFARTLLVVASAACLSGLRRLYGSSTGSRWREAHYLWFGAGFVALLLIWNFPPNERFSLPVFPLLIAGLVAEAKFVWAMFAAGWAKTKGLNRAVAALGLAVLVLLPAGWLWMTGSAVARRIPLMLDNKRELARQREPVYAWIRDHVEPDARLFAYDDPVLYLRTGRTALTFQLPTRFGYSDDTSGVRAEIMKLPAKLRGHKLDYVMLTAHDFGRETSGPVQAGIIAELRQTPGWTQVFESEGAWLYRIGPAAAARAAAR